MKIDKKILESALEYYFNFEKAKETEQSYFQHPVDHQPKWLLDCVDFSEKYKLQLQKLEDRNSPYLKWLSKDANYKAASDELQKKDISRKTQCFHEKPIPHISNDCALKAILAKALIHHRFAIENPKQYLRNSSKIKKVSAKAKFLSSALNDCELVKSRLPHYFINWLDVLCDEKFLTETISNNTLLMVKKTNKESRYDAREIFIKTLAAEYMNNFNCKMPDAEMITSLTSIVDVNISLNTVYRILDGIKSLPGFQKSQK